MKAGNLSDKIVFEARTLTTNAHGQEVETWSSLPALGGFEDMAEVERRGELSCNFIIRYRTARDGSAITPASHRILFEGYVWPIVNIVHDRRYSQYTIECDGASLIEITHLQSTEREYIIGMPVVAPPE